MNLRWYIFVCVWSIISAHKFVLKSGIKPYSTDEFLNGSPFPPFKGCEDKTVPPSRTDISTYKINLDLPPQQRWHEVVEDKKDEMLDLLASIKNNTEQLFGSSVFYLVDKYMPHLAKTLAEPYYEELEGIAAATNISLGEITLFNVFYEFFSVCTSIVMQGKDGKMYHGRNLDFGLFLGWDIANNTWLTTERLRPLVIKLEFLKNNQTVFQSINFAGYIGILTGVKQNAFSLTVDERFKLNGGYVGITEWIFDNHQQKWMGLLTRETMETADSYKSAQKMLAKPQLVAPVYFILAGNESNQGCIITRSRGEYDILSLEQASVYHKSSWYLVQTNYDHWQNPPFYDDRRTPALRCMESLGQAKPQTTLYTVLSTRPVFNKLTTYTALMDVQNGSVEAWLRQCEDPCWPW